MSTYTLAQSTIQLNGELLLSGLNDQISMIPDPRQVGAFLHFSATSPSHLHTWPIGTIEHLQHFMACHRNEPFWMIPTAGNSGDPIPIETQSLLVERSNHTYLLLIPLIDEPLRASLQGSVSITDAIELVAESGDPAVTATTLVGLYLALGEDPYSLVEQSAASVAGWLKSCRLRREKPLPDFMDYFGWCTWDAFYQDVTHEKVRQGLESFISGSIKPRYIILDDGWQSEHSTPTGERRLTAFAANEKFPGDLANTISMAKQDFGIQHFLVWHALNGYWGGVDGSLLTGYNVRDTSRQYSPQISRISPGVVNYWGTNVGVVPPEHIDRFFHDYHRHLRQQGVDGVKVDNQAALEGLSDGSGGRVTMMRRYHEALEGSTSVHFRGALINCMSCSSEMIYSALNSSLTRTSTDFWPNRPETHGLHLYTNAQVGMWFGEFIHPDWDMFQSGHNMGAFHAAGRAVSGAPVYVSDKPDEHDFALLHKLVLPDGSILRARGVGRPTLDCLFHDPTREDILLKIFNHNLQASVVAVFNARCCKNAPELRGALCPTDVPGLYGLQNPGQQYVVYAHNSAEMRILERDQTWPIIMPPLSFEIFTIVPILDGLAPIGLPDLFNSAGAVLTKGYVYPGSYQITLRGGGRFLAWCHHSPTQVEANRVPIDYTYDQITHSLLITLPFNPIPTDIRIAFDIN